MRAISLLALAGLLPLALLFQSAFADPLPAEPARLAAQSLLLDVLQTETGWVAVGERGHVLTSSDGVNWVQADQVPVRSTLLSIAFAEGHLWAVGHDSTIIHSADGGRTWGLQHHEPEQEQPLFAVHFFDARRGLAVGAYGLIMSTEDGGASWDIDTMEDRLSGEDIEWEGLEDEALDEDFDEFFDDEIDEDNDFYDAATDFDRGCYEFLECHLNALLALDDQRLLIAGESGYGFRSEDGGESWESFRFPYRGSMFGLIQFNEQAVLSFGLRGHVQLSEDGGASWMELDSGVQSTLLGATLDAAGRPVLVGNGAAVLRYNPASKRFRVSQDQLGSDYAAAALGSDGRLILAGAGGLKNE